MIPVRSSCIFILFFSTFVVISRPESVLAGGVPEGKFTLAAVKVTGSTTYSAEEVTAATGLQIGQTASDDEFQKASQRLGESGAFTDVAYHYQYSGRGATLELQLKDNPQLVPARFDNFVWFSDQELAQKIHQRVPLFHGRLPLNGDLADQVSEALQALLIEGNIDGKAEYLRSGDLDTAIDAITFSVSGPRLEIRNIDFPGAEQPELPLLQAAAGRLRGQEYSRAAIRVYAEKDFLPIYLQRGYLKATIADGAGNVSQKLTDKTLVDVNLAVDHGSQYKLAKLHWSGNSLFEAAKLEPMLHLQNGSPANPIQLEEGLRAVQRLYGTRGYMAVRIKTIADLDDQNLSVTYDLQMHEGEVYRMGELEIRGIDTPTSRRLVLAWQLREGDTYDASYSERYLEGPARSIVSPDQWDVRVSESVNDSDKTVDVTLKLDPKTP